MRQLAISGLSLALASFDYRATQIQLLEGLRENPYSTYSDEIINEFILPRVTSSMEHQAKDYYKEFLNRLGQVSNVHAHPEHAQLLHSFLRDWSGNLQYEKLIYEVHELCEMEPYLAIWSALSFVDFQFQHLHECQVDSRIKDIMNQQIVEKSEFNPSFKSSERIIRNILIHRMHKLQMNFESYKKDDPTSDPSINECFQYIRATSALQNITIPFSRNLSNSTQFKLTEKILGLHQSLCSLLLKSVVKEDYIAPNEDIDRIKLLYSNPRHSRLASVKFNSLLIEDILKRQVTPVAINSWLVKVLTLLQNKLVSTGTVDEVISEYSTTMEGYCRAMYINYFVLALTSAVSDEDLSKVKDKMINDFDTFRLFRVLSSKLFHVNYLPGVINVINQITCSVLELLYSVKSQANQENIEYFSNAEMNINRDYSFDSIKCNKTITKQEFKQTIKYVVNSVEESLKYTKAIIESLLNNIDNLAHRLNLHFNQFEQSIVEVRASLTDVQKYNKSLSDSQFRNDIEMMSRMSLAESIRGINRYRSLIQSTQKISQIHQTNQLALHHYYWPMDHVIYETAFFDLHSMYIVYSNVLRDRVFKVKAEAMKQFEPYNSLYDASVTDKIFPIIENILLKPTSTEVVFINAIRRATWKQDDEIKNSSLWKSNLSLGFTYKFRISNTEVIEDTSERLSSSAHYTQYSGQIPNQPITSQNDFPDKRIDYQKLRLKTPPQGAGYQRSAGATALNHQPFNSISQPHPDIRNPSAFKSRTTTLPTHNNPGPSGTSASNNEAQEFIIFNAPVYPIIPENRAMNHEKKSAVEGNWQEKTIIPFNDNPITNTPRVSFIDFQQSANNNFSYPTEILGDSEDNLNPSEEQLPLSRKSSFSKTLEIIGGDFSRLFEKEDSATTHLAPSDKGPQTRVPVFPTMQSKQPNHVRIASEEISDTRITEMDELLKKSQDYSSNPRGSTRLESNFAAGPVKRGRGRPRKHDLVPLSSENLQATKKETQDKNLQKTNKRGPENESESRSDSDREVQEKKKPVKKLFDNVREAQVVTTTPAVSSKWGRVLRRRPTNISYVENEGTTDEEQTEEESSAGESEVQKEESNTARSASEEEAGTSSEESKLPLHVSNH